VWSWIRRWVFFHTSIMSSAAASISWEGSNAPSRRFHSIRLSLVNSFVISRIDYCNSLLTGLPKYVLDRLQRVMNAAARMLCSAGKYLHVTGLIRDWLHWLPVAQRIQFKLCLMMYKVMHGLAPAYLSELCASSCVEGRTQSSARSDLVIQRTRTKFGGRAFVVTGPMAWNRLPSSVHNSPSLDSFKTALKPLNRLPCCGALEVIVTLLLLLLLMVDCSDGLLMSFMSLMFCLSKRAVLFWTSVKIWNSTMWINLKLFLIFCNNRFAVGQWLFSVIRVLTLFNLLNVIVFFYGVAISLCYTEEAAWR